MKAFFFSGFILIASMIEPANAAIVKMSNSKICHPPESSHYNRTKNFKPYETVEACLNAGGRLPKGLSLADISTGAQNEDKPDGKTITVSESGNITNQSFNKAKRMLEREVYPSHRETLYCGAKFDEKKNILPLPGFTTTKYLSRAKRLEWEHVVPAENFGRTFSEWRDGHKDCVDSKGKSFRGRKCAEKVSVEYRSFSR